MKILVVEDEMNLGILLKEVLEQNSFTVELSGEGEEALYMATEMCFDLIILDVMLPGISGWTVLQKIRQRGLRTPVLMLTALDAVDYKVKGFNLGADDYLPKPFDMRELLARVSSLLRRSKTGGSLTNDLRCGDLVLDLSSRTVSIAGVPVELRRKEYQILEYLMMNKNRVVSKRELEEHIWSDEEEIWSDVVRSHIKNLRKKIDSVSKTRLISTIRGHGYEISDR